MKRLFAKISPLDFILLHDVIGKSVSDLAPGNDHNDPLRKHHDGAHDVLDQQDRYSLVIQSRQQRKNLVDFAVRKARHDFVGDEDLRSRGQRPAELEFSQLHLGKHLGAGVGLVGKSNLIEDNLRRAADRARRPKTDGKAQRHLDVLLYGHAPERPRNLVGAGQPALRPDPGRSCGNVVAVEGYRSVIGSDYSGKTIYECTLAGTVRADEPDAFSFPQDEVDGGESRESVKPL